MISRAYAKGLILLAVFCVGWSVGSDATEAGYARQAAEATAEARRIEQRRAAMVTEVDDGYRAREKRDRADAVGLARELERLRNSVPERRACAADPAAAGGADGAPDRHGIVVRDCAEALGMVAEAADACESKLIGLQDYVRRMLKQ